MNNRSRFVAGWLFSSAALPFLVEGTKDSSYYPYPDFVNPNTYSKMYWKDSGNVLEDLNEFDSLYIKYHGCVWSSYQNVYSDDDDDGGGEENDYWYLGSPEKFRANTAYSLYGTLKGEKDKGCGRKTYINSFFTHAGVELVAKSLGIDTTYANSYCSSSGDESGDRIRRFLGSGDEDDGSYTSVGTGCSAKGQFVLDEYGGTKCDGTRFMNTTDTLSEFNSDMKNIKCSQIYSSSGGTSFLDILSYSSACSLRVFPKRCPDPYGRLQGYEANMAKAVTLAKQGEQWEFAARRFKFTALGLPMLITGLVFIAFAAYLTRDGPSGSGDQSPKALAVKGVASIRRFFRGLKPTPPPESLYSVNSMVSESDASKSPSLTAEHNRRIQRAEKKLKKKIDAERKKKEEAIAYQNSEEGMAKAHGDLVNTVMRIDEKSS